MGASFQLLRVGENGVKVWFRLKWNERPSVPWAKEQKGILLHVLSISFSLVSGAGGELHKAVYPRS